MPRPTKRTEIATVQTNHEAIASAGQALTVQSQAVTKIMQAYNIKTANKDVLVAEIRAYIDTSVEMMFGIGARLVLLRQQTVRGEWMPLLEQIGMAQSTANQIMLATRKFADINTGIGRDRFVDLDRGKLLELMFLSDEQVSDLEKGELMELDLDEVSRMSTSELRRKVRELKMANEAKDKLAEKRSKEIDKLQEQLSGEFIPEPGSLAQTEKEQAQYVALQAAHLEVIAAHSKLAVVVRDIREQSESQALTEAAESALQHSAQRLAETLQEAGVDVNFAEMITPAWLDVEAIKQSAAAKAKAKAGKK
jgi:hypothetical protein